MSTQIRANILEFDQKKFIQEIRLFMKEHNLSCRKFAWLSGVAFKTLYCLEDGKNEISLRTLRKLITAMRDYKDSEGRD